MVTIENLPGPSSITRYRAERYIGENEAATKSDFPEQDLVLLTSLYETLVAVFGTTKELSSTGTADGIIASATILEWHTTVTEFVEKFGHDRGSSEVSRELYHDLRGGALSLVLLRLQLMTGQDTHAGEDVVALFYATRDHLKIMRNCVLDLDPDGRQRDTARNKHAVSLLREKWDQFHGGELSVSFETDFDGAISSCCLEFSSLERVLYNLMNNAAEHSADNCVRLFAKRIGDPETGDVRFATVNTVRSTERDTLREKFGADLGQLFRGGFTIGGHGIGLGVAREIVSNAYGLSDSSVAIEKGYVGAELHGDAIVVWVHWPIMQ